MPGMSHLHVLARHQSRCCGSSRPVSGLDHFVAAADYHKSELETGSLVPNFYHGSAV